MGKKAVRGRRAARRCPPQRRRPRQMDLLSSLAGGTVAGRGVHRRARDRAGDVRLDLDRLARWSFTGRPRAPSRSRAASSAASPPQRCSRRWTCSSAAAVPLPELPQLAAGLLPVADLYPRRRVRAPPRDGGAAEPRVPEVQRARWSAGRRGSSPSRRPRAGDRRGPRRGPRESPSPTTASTARSTGAATRNASPRPRPPSASKVTTSSSSATSSRARTSCG